MQRYEFLVGERPLCIWDWNLADKNRRFLRGIEPNYFAYVAESNAPGGDEPRDHHAALALRIGYSHGLETLMAFAGAALQAPGCPLGWILQYSPKELFQVVDRMSRRGDLPARNGVEGSWAGLAKAVVEPADLPVERKQELVGAFSGLWERFAHDYLDRVLRDEYNSLKHGFRVSPGGFVLRIGIEAEYGTAPPEEQMQILGASPYGSSFFVVERLLEGKTDFRARDYSRNWHPESLAAGLHLIGLSLHNVLCFLRYRSGEAPLAVGLQSLADESGYDAPWALQGGTETLNWDRNVRREDIQPSDPVAIRAKYG